MTNGRPTPHELLSAYHDGELTAAERQEVERLLEDSADARAELEDYRALSEMLRALPAEPVPAGTRAAVLRRIERELLLPAAPRVPVPRKPRRKLWVFAGLFTSAAAILLVAVIAERNRPGKPDDQLVAAADKAPRTESVEHLSRLSRSLAAEAAPVSREPDSNEMLAKAKTPTDAAGLASVSNAVAAKSLAFGKDTATGDVLSYLEQRPDGEVVVVQATVVDVREALNSLQVLLAKNSIPMQPTSFDMVGGVGGAAGFGSGGPSLGAAADERGGELEAVYVESDPARINAALADLNREKDQFVDVQVAGVLNPTAHYGVPLGLRYDRPGGAAARGRDEETPGEEKRSEAATFGGAAAAGPAQARFMVPPEPIRKKRSAAPALAPAGPPARGFQPLEAAKPQVPLADAVEPAAATNAPAASANAPAASANAPAADQPAASWRFQTTLNVSKSQLQQQIQPVREMGRLTESREGLNFYYSDQDLGAKQAQSAQDVKLSDRNAGPREGALNRGEADGEAELFERQQVQRRMRVLVVLERQGEEPLEKAAKAKADAGRLPVEAPQPARKKG
jgi:hypothetical protein